MTHLNVMLGELLCERPTRTGRGIDCIVDGHLAILVVQPGVDILPALLQDLLPEYDGRGGGIREEVVFGYLTSFADRCATVVSKMEDTGLDTQPAVWCISICKC